MMMIVEEGKTVVAVHEKLSFHSVGFPDTYMMAGIDSACLLLSFAARQRTELNTRTGTSKL